MEMWEKEVQNNREVLVTILNEKGNIYIGVYIDTYCSLEIVAERNAVFNMFKNGEYKISKLVCILKDGTVDTPCAGRELLIELDVESE